MRVLIVFRHGLGDTVQFTSVLRHLRHYHPDWRLHVALLIGKHSAVTGLADEVHVLDYGPVDVGPLDAGPFDAVFELDWWECDRTYAGHPATKVEKCLLEVFDLEPIVELCGYSIQVGSEVGAAAAAYLQGISGSRGPDGRFRTVVLHYQGNTSQDRKNLDHQTARNVCEQATAAGYAPIVLDWDHRSPLPGDGRIFCPDASHWLWGGVGTGDAEMVAALIDQSSLFVGIDSGPQKVAAATETPALAVWTGHHPLHYCGIADTTVHLVPNGHQELIRGDRALGRAVFESLYRHRVYADVRAELAAAISELLGDGPEGMVHHRGFAVRRDNIEPDDVVIQDVFERDAYAVAHLPMPEEIVVDVGAHIGCFAAAWRRRNPSARIICVEACRENLAALKANVGGFARIIHAACTYETEPVALLNSVWSGCVSTGGSRVVRASSLAIESIERRGQVEYWHDARPLPSITLEDIIQSCDLPRVDVLKLDCEGSEFSILRGAAQGTLDGMRVILGECHGVDQFRALARDRFGEWTAHIGAPDRYGNDVAPFWLFNPRRP